MGREDGGPKATHSVKIVGRGMVDLIEGHSILGKVGITRYQLSPGRGA